MARKAHAPAANTIGGSSPKKKAEGENRSVEDMPAKCQCHGFACPSKCMHASDQCSEHRSLSNLWENWQLVLHVQVGEKGEPATLAPMPATIPKDNAAAEGVISVSLNCRIRNDATTAVISNTHTMRSSSCVLVCTIINNLSVDLD